MLRSSGDEGLYAGVRCAEGGGLSHCCACGDDSFVHRRLTNKGKYLMDMCKKERARERGQTSR